MICNAPSLNQRWVDNENCVRAIAVALKVLRKLGHPVKDCPTRGRRGVPLDALTGADAVCEPAAPKAAQ